MHTKRGRKLFLQTAWLVAQNSELFWCLRGWDRDWGDFGKGLEVQREWFGSCDQTSLQ